MRPAFIVIHRFTPLARVLVQPSTIPALRLERFRDITAITEEMNELRAGKQISQLRHNLDVTGRLVAPTNLAGTLDMLSIDDLYDVAQKRVFELGHLPLKFAGIQLHVRPAIMIDHSLRDVMNLVRAERPIGIQLFT